MRPKLSRYQILGRLASGGMADVWMARVVGPAGFEKKVVLKTLLPTLAADQKFVRMFITEARVAALLNHPNCVQIFDFGEEAGITFLAMEFIEGFSLSRILRRVRARGELMPTDVTARILMDVCSGLESAHRLTDGEGNPMSLVHRDVSTDNVMVSFTGHSKLLDFGIARAATRQEPATQTRPGTVKGKFGYMAPEYLRGDPIDGRADLFSLGVVGYRALTGKRPFAGQTDAVVAMSVMTAAPPSLRTFAPLVPEALEQVITRALAKNAEERFESAKAMRSAIEASVPRVADTEAVGAWIEQLWPPDDEERRALMDLAAGRIEDTSSPVLAAPGSDDVELSEGNRVGLSVTREVPTDVRPERGRRSRALGVAAAVVVVLGAALGLALWSGSGPGADAAEVDAGVLAAVAGSADAGTGPEAAVPVVPQAEVPDAPDAPDAATPDEAVAGIDGDDVDGGVEGPEAGGPGGVRRGRVHVSSTPPTTVMVGGRARGRTPVTVSVPAGSVSLRLVDRSLGIDRPLVVRVRPGATVEAGLTIGKGTLDVRVSPWANVVIDGRAVGTTPLAEQELYEGRHVVELSNPELGKKKTLQVTIKPGKKEIVREAL